MLGIEDTVTTRAVLRQNAQPLFKHADRGMTILRCHGFFMMEYLLMHCDETPLKDSCRILGKVVEGQPKLSWVDCNFLERHL